MLAQLPYQFGFISRIASDESELGKLARFDFHVPGNGDDALALPLYVVLPPGRYRDGLDRYALGNLEVRRYRRHFTLGRATNHILLGGAGTGLSWRNAHMSLRD